MLQRGGVCDIRCQAFWTSVIKNEEDMRRRWYNKNQDLLLENFKLEDKKLQELKQQSKKGSSKEHFEKKKKQIKRKIEKSENHEEKDTINLSFMKPVDFRVKNILYESGVESYAASNNYLRERYKEKPVDRFNYQECSSWEIGWHLKDYPPIPLSEVGIRSIIQTSFYRRDASSLTRDPNWYKMCQTTNAKNFNEILTY